MNYGPPDFCSKSPHNIFRTCHKDNLYQFSALFAETVGEDRFFPFFHLKISYFFIYMGDSRAVCTTLLIRMEAKLLFLPWAPQSKKGVKSTHVTRKQTCQHFKIHLREDELDVVAFSHKITTPLNITRYTCSAFLQN